MYINGGDRTAKLAVEEQPTKLADRVVSLENAVASAASMAEEIKSKLFGPTVCQGTEIRDVNMLTVESSIKTSLETINDCINTLGAILSRL